jgi:epoxyqueuosine reductase QueG
MPPKVCPTERGMGKHSAEAKSQRPDLLHPYLYRARNLVERFFNKSSNVGVS